MKTALLALALVTASVCAVAADTPPASYVTAAVAASSRPKEDTDRDALRKPAELIAFAGIKPGDRVADILPGGGYFTRIFSGVVGPKGHVFAVLPTEFAQKFPKAADGLKALATGNVSAVIKPTASIAAPEPLDVAWTSDNYHDVYGFFGKEQAAAFDVAVYKALKPGGVFIIVDHAAKAGASDTSTTTLHRIDPAIVKAQAAAAGFVLEAESPLLQNPADTHEAKIFDPAIRGHTDQFVFKFRKPAH
jgi:predicted methyltransferase